MFKIITIILQSKFEILLIMYLCTSSQVHYSAFLVALYFQTVNIQLSTNSRDTFNFSDNELQTNYDDDGELEEYDSGSQTLELAFYTAILCVIALVYGHEWFENTTKNTLSNKITISNNDNNLLIRIDNIII